MRDCLHLRSMKKDGLTLLDPQHPIYYTSLGLFLEKMNKAQALEIIMDKLGLKKAVIMEDSEANIRGILKMANRRGFPIFIIYNCQHSVIAAHIIKNILPKNSREFIMGPFINHIISCASICIPDIDTQTAAIQQIMQDLQMQAEHQTALAQTTKQKITEILTTLKSKTSGLTTDNVDASRDDMHTNLERLERLIEKSQEELKHVHQINARLTMTQSTLEAQKQYVLDNLHELKKTHPFLKGYGSAHTSP